MGNCIQKNHLNEKVILINVSTDEKENNHNFMLKKFAYLDLWRKADFTILSVAIGKSFHVYRVIQNSN